MDLKRLHREPFLTILYLSPVAAKMIFSAKKNHKISDLQIALTQLKKVIKH